MARRGGPAGGARLEGEPDVEDAVEVVGRELGDARAAVRQDLDEALGREPAQRLADGGARHPEPLRQLDLAEVRPGGQLAAQDGLPQGDVGALRGATSRRRRDHSHLRCMQRRVSGAGMTRVSARVVHTAGGPLMADLLSHPTGRRARLRSLLAGDRPVVAPGAYDALSARLVEQAGFDVVYMTGFGTTASLLGRPDVGLLGQAEMVDNARRMASVRRRAADRRRRHRLRQPDQRHPHRARVRAGRRRGAAPRGPGAARRSAGTWRARRSCPSTRWPRRSGPRSTPAPTPTS